MLSELVSSVRCRGLQSVLHNQIYPWRLCSSFSCDHYNVLGVHRDATKEEIRDAFVKLSKELHPDRNPDDPNTHYKFVQLNEAYSILSKPKSRGDYDIQLWMHRQQRAAQAATSYSYSSSHRPGTGFTSESDYDERIFWDETLFHMRDRSKDKSDIKDDEYYGIKGIKKLSNSAIVWACLIFASVGAFLQFGILTSSSKHSMSKMKEHDIKAGRAHRQARERARLHGNQLQLELLRKRAIAQASTQSDSR